MFPVSNAGELSDDVRGKVTKLHNVGGIGRGWKVPRAGIPGPSSDPFRIPVP